MLKSNSTPSAATAAAATATPVNGATTSTKDHLVVLVNGMAGRPENWAFLISYFQQHGHPSLLLHCCQSLRVTSVGIDILGVRLAEEVRQVIAANQQLVKISFIAHSLGGLAARCAVGHLWSEGSSPGGNGSHGTGSDIGKEGGQAAGEVRRKEQQGMQAGRERVEGELQGVDGESGGRGLLKCCNKEEMDGGCGNARKCGLIGGLQPVNFITLASPHLGSASAENLPLLKLLGGLPLDHAFPLANRIYGQTGSQLFLLDAGACYVPKNGEDKNDERQTAGQPKEEKTGGEELVAGTLESGNHEEEQLLPFLVLLARDSSYSSFLSALKSFKRRVAYANVVGDQMVGWLTSSIRLPWERPLEVNMAEDPEYKFVIKLKGHEMHNHEAQTMEVGVHEDADSKLKTYVKGELPCHHRDHATWNDNMVCSLNEAKWDRIDVNFAKSPFFFMAHNLIQVKNAWIHKDGISVVRHLHDHFMA